MGGGRALGLVGAGQRARPGGRSYDNRFRTHPDPTVPAGVAHLCRHRRFRRRREEGLADAPAAAGGQRAAPRGRHRRRPADAHDRRQHLRRHAAARDSDRRHRRRRRRLVLHLLPAVSLHHQPRAGVSVDRQPRRGRDRGARRSRAGRRQLLPPRADGRRRRGGRPRLVRSGAVLPIPLRLRHRVRLHRHVEGRLLPGAPAVRVSRSTGSSSRRRSRTIAARAVWRIPFCHHPPYCAGPQHHNTEGHGAAAPAVRARRA